MANPSDTGPSGVGTEVLRRSYINELGEAEGTLITGVANHIYTVLSIVICEVGNRSDGQINLYIDFDAGGTDLIILKNQVIATYSTFIFSDKFVVTGTDKLQLTPSSSGGSALYNIWCSYIDQDWS